MKKLSFLAVILVLALLLSGCGVEYVNQFADIPKPEAVFTLDVDGVIYYLRFTLDHDGPLVSPADFDADYWREAEGPRRSFNHQPNKK